MAIGPRLRAVLGLDRSQFSRGLKGAEGEVDSFGRKVKGIGASLTAALGVGIPAVTVASTVSFLRQTVRGIAEIGDEARRSGLSMRAFQEWKFVAEQNRIGVDALVDGFKELNLRADEFIVTGGGSAAEAFQRLGFSAADLKEKLKDPSALMLEIIGRLQRFNGAARIRITDELFGGAGGEQLLQILGKSREELEAIINRGHQLGAVMDDQMIRKAEELDRKFAEVEARIGSLIKTAVVNGFEMTEVYARFREENGALLSIFEAALPGLKLFGSTATAVFGDAASEANRLANSLTGVFDEAADSAAGLEFELRDLFDQLLRSRSPGQANEFRELADEIARLVQQYQAGELAAGDLAAAQKIFEERLEGLREKADKAVTGLSNIDGVTTANAVSQIGNVTKALSAAEMAARALASQMPGAAPDGGEAVLGQTRGSMNWWWNQRVESILPPVAGFIKPPETKSTKSKGGGKQNDFERELEQTRDQIAALEAEALILAQVASGNQRLGDAMEFARKKAELLLAAKKAGKEITPALTAEIEKQAMAYMTAGLNAEAAAEKLDRIKENSDRGADAMTNLFSGILQGSDVAKKAVADLLAEIAKVRLRKAVLGLGGGGGGGVFGFLGGMLASNSRGTNNFAGGWSRVNELGGEIMNLPNGTQIIPHDISKRMADASGAGGVLEVRLGAGLEAQWLSRAAQNSVQISQAGDMRMADISRRALPGQIRDAQARGLR